MRSDPARDGGRPVPRRHFVLYVEGPRDRDILRHWAHRISAPLSRSLESSAVILGGRQPARALEHFRELKSDREAATEPARGVCVLDRDGGPPDDPVADVEAGLEFFTWRRRHIEAYLLVPEAIRRSLRQPRDDSRVERLLSEHLPEGDDDPAWLELDAKRLLSERGPLARALGRRLEPGRIAFAMRDAELHADVRALFLQVRDALGMPEPAQSFKGSSGRER